ncbi:hypothetical protein COLO4_05412 [Corchorus olitorius]|uniref:Uncharacterized protein n=1 Tax=Corchorus olitorius TaxID=93759 RepID=A0A1R3KQY3_9ROSI|nr:hypothetical protein COLO4_05412 [Corchorus olitorius]
MVSPPRLSSDGPLIRLKIPRELPLVLLSTAPWIRIKGEARRELKRGKGNLQR